VGPEAERVLTTYYSLRRQERPGEERDTARTTILVRG